MMRLVMALLCSLVLTPPAMAELQNVVTGGPPPGTLMRGVGPAKDYEERFAEAFAARKARVDALNTTEEIAAYQQEKYDYFVDALGGFPARTPLNARVVGEGDGGDYRYEKIIYESQPGFFVTAVLFLPKGEGPFPGVLVPCGHSNNGKAAETYQRASILLAKNGMAALCYDPIGQGERYHFLKDDGKPEFGTTTHHTLMGVGAILTGTNIAMYRIYDGIRGLDYLESRPDIDPKRLACTGNSGGGTLTSYIMALDPRVTVAAPSCYLTNFDKLLHTIAPQDAEQNIFGQIANGLDHTEYMHLRAPKPTLMCVATHDVFDIEGAWATFREAKQIYTKLGYPERVNLVEANEKHGFSKPLRQAMVQWMRRWLLDIDEALVEPDFPIHSDAEMLCTPDGHVLNLEGARSIFALNQDRSEALAALRTEARKNVNADDLRETIATFLDYDRGAFADPADAATIALEPATPRIEMKIHQEEREKFAHKLYIELRALVPQDTADAYLATNPPAAQRNGETEDGLAILHFYDVYVPNIWPDDKNHGQEKTVGADWPGFFRAYLLGDSYLSYWIDAITLRLAEAQEIRKALGTTPLPLVVHATDWTTVPALHAAALNPGRMDKLILEDGIPSWSEVVATPRAKNQLLTTVHGALEVYDLPDLVTLCPEGSVEIINAHVPEF